MIATLIGIGTFLLIVMIGSLGILGLLALVDSLDAALGHRLAGRQG